MNNKVLSEQNKFMKNLISSIYKLKTKYIFKSLTEVSCSIKYIELTNTLKDIFSKSNKSICMNYLINGKTSIQLKEISNEESSSLLYRVSSKKCSEVEARFVKDSKNDKDINIEIWTNNVLFKTIQLNEFAIKLVYFDEIFGKPQFSDNMTKLIFLAEVDDKKSLKHYFSIPEDEKFDEEFSKTLNKFDYKQEFGELLPGKSEPKIFVLDLINLKMLNIKFNNLGNNYIAHPIFDEKSEGVVFTAYDFPFFKYGLVYCMKRKSDIYYLKNPKFEELPKKSKKNEDDKTSESEINDFYSAVKISNSDNTNILQKFSDDFNFLIYFSNEKATPHNNGLRVNIVKWKESVQDSKVLIDKVNKCNDYFNGIYEDEGSIQANDFIGNELFVFSTTFKNIVKSFIYHIESNILLDLNSHFQDYPNVSILKIYKNYIIVSAEDVNKLPDVFLITINIESIRSFLTSINKSNLIQLENKNLYYKGSFLNDGEDIIKITDSLGYLKSLQNNIILNDQSKDMLNYLGEVINSTVVRDEISNGIFGHVIYSEKAKNPIKEQLFKRPVLFYLHGGPNSCLDRSFLISNLSFLSIGYFVLVINYPGSTGFGQDYLSSLSGRIGELDVESCGEFLIRIMKKYEDLVDPENVMLFGGSHGGFLSSWLISHEKYCKMFRSCVIRNPVTDLVSSMATTDIPDWVYEQTLNKELSYPPKLEDYVEMYKKSPIFRADNAVTPTLIMLGKVDLRVSIFNGLYLYNCLRKNNVKTKLVMYPEDSHPLANAETEIDNFFNFLQWFQSNLK